MSLLTPEHGARLATWPDREYTDTVTGRSVIYHADGRDYARLLLGTLLRREPRVLIESSVVIYADEVDYYECLVRLTSRHRHVELIAGGPNIEAARFNAELFAIRQAVLNDEVPVLGTLLRHGRLRADLRPLKGEPLIAGWYDLVVREDQRGRAELGGAVALPRRLKVPEVVASG